MRKGHSNNIPKSIEYIGLGQWSVRWNIQEDTNSFINENDYVYLYNLKKNTNYIAFRTHNNRLNNECIKCLDILIIEKDLNNLENKLVLILINDKYRILKYQKNHKLYV